MNPIYDTLLNYLLSITIMLLMVVAVITFISALSGCSLSTQAQINATDIPCYTFK